MSSDEIQVVYKKLVQAYARAHPSNALWLLDQHLKAYVQHTWPLMESAILDLALRNGIEIPSVTQLMDQGVSKQDAITQVSQSMTLDVTEAETNAWVDEVFDHEEKLLQMKRQSESEGDGRREYEETIRRLTMMFHNGDISEESYRTAIRSLETETHESDAAKPDRKVRITRSAETPETRSPPYPTDIYGSPRARGYRTQPSALWYLVPIFLGLLGALVAYVAVKDDDEGMAIGLIAVGVVMFVIEIIIFFFYYGWILSLLY